MAETDSEPKTKSDVYRERNLLALAYIRARVYYAEVHGGSLAYGWWQDEDDVNGEEWAVVWMGYGDEQVGWHIPVEMVPDWMPERDPKYDGYSTEEKNQRVAGFAEVE